MRVCGLIYRVLLRAGTCQALTMARVLQSFTDATVDGEECWETLCDLDEADVDSVVEDIGVHCLVNGETAGYKDQCTGGSGASTEEAGGKRRRLTGKTVLQTSIAELSASVNWNDIICESLETLIHDEHLICTPRGKRSIEIASQVVDAKSSHEFECFCGDVGAKLLNCMSKAASRCRLPGTFRRKLWSHFHDLRTNSEFVNRWQTFVQSLKSECADDPLIFQCLLDRAFKKLISVHSGILYKPTEEPDVEILLTSREKNAIRYMAGFVMLRLKQRTTKNPLYQCILKQLCAKGQDLTVNSLDAYTTKWMDTISRGGLYHITDEVSYHYLEYSCTNSTNQITHCEVSKSDRKPVWGFLLSLEPPGYTIIVYCQLKILHKNYSMQLL